jgi:phage replication initiation protein
MKKIPEACSLESMRLPASELADIGAQVAQSIALAHQRKAAAAAADEERERRAAAASAPSTNRGVKSEIAARLVLEDGKCLEIPARRTWGGDSSILDWVNFTTDERDFMFGKTLISDEEIIDRVSYYCKEIFGFGITEERPTGANFYHRSYVLGDKCGMVCHGGQKSTVLVMLSGDGCSAAREGWEKRLFDFLTTRCGSRAKLTRVDLAYDDYAGTRYSVDQADADFDANRFNCGGRNPNHEYRGNWKRPNGKGRTLYIGNRDSGKFCRVYEKGRQLGDKSSEWVRVEVEMKAVQRILPFEILLNPGQYLAASYPAFAWIKDRQERVLTIQKKTEMTYQSAVANAKKQIGAVVNVMLEIEGSAERVVDMLIKHGRIPSRLKNPSWLFVKDGDAIHEQPRIPLNKDCFDELALA